MNTPLHAPKIIIFTLLFTFAQSQIFNTDSAILDQGFATTQTIQALKYQGYVEASVGELGSFTYNVLFVQDLGTDCPKLLCFSGYIEKYWDQDYVILGYANSSLSAKPVFELQTSGPGDVIIKTNPELEQTWVDIIQVACHSFVPPYDSSRSKKTKAKFSSSPSLTIYFLSEYTSRSLSPFSSTTDRTLVQEYGGIAEYTLTKKLQFLDLDGKESSLTDRIIITNDKLVGLSERSIYLNIGDEAALLDNRSLNDSDAQLMNLEANIKMNLKKIETTTIPLSVFVEIKEAASGWTGSTLSDKLLYTPTTFVDLNAINPILLTTTSLISQTATEVQAQKSPGYGDSPIYGNQVYTGVNAIEQFSTETTSSSLTVDSRNLQTTQIFNILNENKVIYSKTILSKKFEVSLNTKCDLLVLSFDVKVNCVGKVYVQYFGQIKSVQIFDITKSVSFEWTHTKSFSGNWAASIWVGLPKPVHFIGLTLAISLDYQINLVLEGSVADPTPYTYQVAADVDAVVETDSSASLRVGIFQGGVRIFGSLANLSTKPIVKVEFLFSQKMIKFYILWSAKLEYFSASWQVRYRWKRLGNWSSWRTLFTKNFSTGSKSWNLKNQSFTVNL